jgi:hypothetical protein
MNGWMIANRGREGGMILLSLSVAIPYHYYYYYYYHHTILAYSEVSIIPHLILLTRSV